MSNRTLTCRRGESGSALIVTLLILFAVAAIGMTLSSVSTLDLKISGNERTSKQALFVAEAGLNEAMHRLMIPSPTTATVGGWTGNVAIADSEPLDPNWTVKLYLSNPGSVPAGSGSVHTTGTVQNLSSGDALAYSVGSGSEGVLTIQHKWIDRDGDGARDQNEIVRYDRIQAPPENFVSGSPVEVVTVAGRAGSGREMILAEVCKERAIVRTLGALYLDKAVELTGSSSFCGYDHDFAIPDETPVSDPGTGGGGGGGGAGLALCDDYHLSAGSLPGVTTTGDEIQVRGSSDVVGYPSPLNKSASNPFYSLSQTLGMDDAQVQRILADADNRTIVNPLRGITYINGDANITSNLTGEGLLYITGDLHAAGEFIYKGLVYVEGDVRFTGSPWILGSMIVRGTTDFNFSSGNAAILYSSEALKRALDSAMPGLVLSWKDI